MKNNGNKKRNIRWTLVLYDIVIYLVVAALLLVLYGGNDKLATVTVIQQMLLSAICVFAARLIGNVYGQVWRYGGIQCYIRLLFTDAIAFWVYVLLEMILPVHKITFARMLALFCMNVLGALTLRMMYRYAYKCGNQETLHGRFLAKLLYIVSGVQAASDKEVQKIKIAIIGAGRVGVSFAEELLNNEEAAYIPRCFIDTNLIRKKSVVKFREFQYTQKTKQRSRDLQNTKYRKSSLRFHPWMLTRKRLCTNTTRKPDTN